MEKVREFMNKEVISFSPDETIFAAAKKLSQYNIAGAPVVDQNKMIGVISISDIIKFINIKIGKIPKITTPGLSNLFLVLLQMKKGCKDFEEELRKISSFKVKDVMTKNVVIASPTMNVIEVAELMEKYDVNRLPVVENGKLVGIVARADLIKAIIS